MQIIHANSDAKIRSVFGKAATTGHARLPSGQSAVTADGIYLSQSYLAAYLRAERPPRKVTEEARD